MHCKSADVVKHDVPTNNKNQQTLQAVIHYLNVCKACFGGVPYGTGVILISEDKLLFFIPLCIRKLEANEKKLIMEGIDE